MEIKTTITIDNLTTETVSVKTQKVISVDGTAYPLGEPHRCAYANTDESKNQMINDVPEPYLSAILDVWGT